MARLTGMRRIPRTIAVLAVAPLGFVLCGCGGARSTQSPSPSVTTISRTLSGAGSGSGPVVMASRVGTPGAPSVSPPRRSDCVSSTEEATVRPNDELGPICLLVGAILRVTSAPSPTQPWQLLSTSDSSVLRCASTAGPNGTIAGSCQALKPGTVLVSTQTKSPADGAADRWRLTVVVE